MTPITTPNPDGSSRYTPPPDAIPARLVPALACRAASRIVQLRKAVDDLRSKNPAAHAVVGPWIAPYLGVLPWESELMSGKIEGVHEALVGMCEELEGEAAR